MPFSSSFSIATLYAPSDWYGMVWYGGLMIAIRLEAGYSYIKVSPALQPSPSSCTDAGLLLRKAKGLVTWSLTLELQIQDLDRT